MEGNDVRALLITGTVGAGKTTTAERVGGLLAASGVPHAVLDLDQLRMAWPAPADDPFFGSLELANLAAVTPNFLAAGARRLVLAGVLETMEDRWRRTRAVAMPMQVCRLRVDLELLRERLRARHTGDPDALSWHLDRVATLQQIQDESRVEDVLLDVSAPVDPDDLAATLLDAVGWSPAVPA